MTNYNDGKWHGWNGGDCPVHPKTIVEYVWHDPIRSTAGFGGARLAYDFGHSRLAWVHVVKFRVIKEHKEPREYWLVRDYKNDYFHVTDTEPDYNDWFEVKHVREVTK